MKLAMKAAVDKLIARTCRDSFFQMFCEFWPLVAAERLVPNWHIQVMCDELQLAAERVFLDIPKEYDLICNCPPGSTKSTIFSVLYQPWVWTRMPSARFITGSHSEALAFDLSRKARDVVMSDKYRRLFPDVKLREDQNTKGYFATTAGGFRKAVGVGGGIIGYHAHFLIVDDPIDPQGALSDPLINEANSWMSETLSQRKVDKQVAFTSLVMQRLHQNDPSGNWFDRPKSRVRKLLIPCDSTWPIEPPGLKWHYDEAEGLMDPVRLSPSVLEEARDVLGDTGFAGQYGQQPSPRGGAMFKTDRLRYEPTPPTKWKRGPVRYWDKACLVAGTIVETAEGAKPIESVEIGNLVLTRDGYQPVVSSGLTKEVDEVVSVLYSDGSVVTGTPDHLVWSENRGWIPLVDASASDYNVSRVLETCGSEAASWQGEGRSGGPTPKSGSSWASPTGDAPESGISSRTAGTPSAGATITKPSTKPCGGSTTVTSPLAMTCITKTTTQVTTTLRILSASPTEAICVTIGGVGRPKAVAGLLRKWLLGRRRRRAAKPSATTDSSRPNESLCVPCPANNAGRTTNVARGIRDLVTALATAAGRLTVDGSVPVYDLTLADSHEFFANGILVHNSTSGAGSWTVGVKLGVDHNDVVWVLDVVRGRWESGHREREVLQTAKVDGKHVRIGIEQEPGGGGKEAAENAARNYARAGYRCTIDVVRGTKEQRAGGAENEMGADTFSVEVNTGNVVLVNGPWNKAYVDELKHFPHSRFKDQVDASSGGYRMLTKKRFRLGVL